MRRSEERAGSLRPPKPVFERIKLPAILLAYIGISEWADPFPSHVSLPARLAVAALILFVLREIHHARLEEDEEWASRTARAEKKLRNQTSRVSRHTWLKIQRVAVWVISLYILGAALNMLTDRCDSAAQCTVLAPRMAIENLPQFLQFAVFVSLTLVQLGIMFYAMVKVGSYKLVMPGTVGVTFDDVWGQDKAKSKVMEQVQLLEESDEVEAAGGFMPKGLLLYGPPGTGKTYLAKAAANYSSKPLILVPPGAFQAPQPLDEPVLTPTGWATMGEIQPGDFVVGVDGLPVRVAGVYDRGEDDVFEVEFSDGAKTRATADHLWSVQRTGVRESVIVHTHQLRCSTTARDAIPLVEVQYSEIDLPIPPYTMGALLGDGCLTTPTPVISCCDGQILDEIEAEGVMLRRTLRDSGVHNASLSVSLGASKNPYTTALEEVGLRGTQAATKFIPDGYLFASVEQRRALLAGLLDTDGSVASHGRGGFVDHSAKVSYTSSSERLARDVVHLVRSLGGTATMRAHSKVSGEPHYYVSIQTPFNPFRLNRKAARWAPPHRLSRRVKSVQLVGRAQVRCLLVEDPRHLYVTRDFVVTHNTFVGINLLKVWMLFRDIRKLARRYGGVIVFIDEIDSLGSRGGEVDQGAEPTRPEYQGCVRQFRPAEPRRMVIGTAQMGTLEAFLSAMDGMEQPRGFINRVLVFCGFKPLRPYDYKYLMMGACQPLDTPVLTPSGWTTMGEVKEGSEVVGADGKPVRVIGVYDRGADDVFEVTFSDGARTRATADHLWRAQRKYHRNVHWKGPEHKTVRTDELRTASWRRDSVPIPTAPLFAERELPIPPYTLGAMLGDGSFRAKTPAICVSDPEIIDAIEGEGASLSRSAPVALESGTIMYSARLTSGRKGRAAGPNDYIRLLTSMGLWGTDSSTKFIPGDYLTASEPQRRALLAGLLDTDGTVKSRGEAEFYSKSESLALGVVELARSLGGTASVSKRGEQDLYVVRMLVPSNPFRLGRKADKWRVPVRLSRRVISVEPAGRVPVRCILVDDPEHLYITEDYVVTHNTNMMERLDPALLRAGRFGRKIHVTYPKVDGRQRTYEGYLAKVSNDLSPEHVEWAARNHAKGTGAEIKDTVNEALLISFRDDRDDPGVVHFDDLMRAMIWIGLGESDGPFEREKARWGVAVHEAGHAVAFHLLCRERQHIWFASIEQRGSTGGMVVPTPLDEDWLMTRSELLADIQVSLASRVAEEILLGEASNGHGGDGGHATEQARKMVRYGHAKTLGVYRDTEDEVREQTESILREALDACWRALEPRKDDVEAVARLLYEKGTVAGDDIHRLLGEKT